MHTDAIALAVREAEIGALHEYELGLSGSEPSVRVEGVGVLAVDGGIEGQGAGVGCCSTETSVNGVAEGFVVSGEQVSSK